jgi:hypothetical protein
VALFATLAAIANAGVCAIYGPPIPRVTDEYGYLLTADTLSHGRLANPPPPHPALTGRHALSSPTYASKYPIGQGALLALGQWLGSPVIGIWLGAALLCGAAVWCFDGWLGKPAATAAALLLLLRVGVGSYWNQSYWGGSLAAAGGLLLYGGLGWMRRGRHLEGAAAAGCGGALLILTRPFEGLLASLPALAWLGACLWKSRGAGRRTLLAGACVALPAVLALGVTALHDRAVTGDALLLPHVHFERSHALAPEWVWSRFDAATGTSSWVDRPRKPHDHHGWWWRSLRHLFGRMARISYFALGLSLAPVLVLVPCLRDPAWRLAALACLAVLAGNAVVEVYFPHYSAPLLAPLYLATFLSVEALARKPRRSALAWGAVLAALASSLATAVVQAPAHRPDRVQPSDRMQQVRTRLAAEAGRHLVMTPTWQDLVFNGADLADAPILWAAPENDQDWSELEALYPDRTVWWFDPTAEPSLIRGEKHRRPPTVSPPDAPPPAPS